MLLCLVVVFLSRIGTGVISTTLDSTSSAQRKKVAQSSSKKTLWRKAKQLCWMIGICAAACTPGCVATPPQGGPLGDILSTSSTQWPQMVSAAPSITVQPPERCQCFHILACACMCTPTCTIDRLPVALRSSRGRRT